MTFKNPLWLVAFLPVVGLLIWKWRRKDQVSIRYSDLSSLKGLESRSDRWKKRTPLILRGVILALMVLTLARPQGVEEATEIITHGVDILIVLDASASMAAEDLSPNRLAVAKKTVRTFIQKRDSDRIGLVVFGGEAYTQCPLTSDTEMLASIVEQTYLNMAGDGTAIGTAIATGLNRIKSSTAKSKVMILVTDGENNKGEIDPLMAAELAKTLGVKIYTIGIGQEGGARIPYIDPIQGKKVYSDNRTVLDEGTLKKIAATTQGRYFRATKSSKLQMIFNEIDRLEKTEIKSKKNTEHREYFPELLKLIVVLLILEKIAAWTWCRRVP